MGRPRFTKVKEWDECPLFMTVDQIVDYLGFGRPVVDRWIKEPTFPLIDEGTQKVEKENLRLWLDQKFASRVLKYKQEEMTARVNKETLDKIQILLSTKEEVI